MYEYSSLVRGCCLTLTRPEVLGGAGSGGPNGISVPADLPPTVSEPSIARMSNGEESAPLHSGGAGMSSQAQNPTPVSKKSSGEQSLELAL